MNIFDDSLQCYLKLVVLLYADDMVLFAESMEDLQDLLDNFQIYCSQWKLKVNSEKWKVVIFGDKSRHRNPISYKDQPLVVDCFKYLGVALQKSRSFYQSKNISWTRQGKHCLVYIEYLEVTLRLSIEIF